MWVAVCGAGLVICLELGADLHMARVNTEVVMMISASIGLICCIQYKFWRFVGEEPDLSDGNFKPKPGSRVQVNLDCDVFETLQQSHGFWHPALAKVSVTD